MTRTLLVCLWLSVLLPQTASAASPEAEEEQTEALVSASPFAPEIREHFYSVLSRSPTKAFLWELALPGAGHVYTGFPIQAAVAAGLSCAGAAMWIAGAVRDLRPWWIAGATTFGVGRVYGLISAPVTAALLNAAYRRQLGITGSF